MLVLSRMHGQSAKAETSVEHEDSGKPFREKQGQKPHTHNSRATALEEAGGALFDGFPLAVGANSSLGCWLLQELHDGRGLFRGRQSVRRTAELLALGTLPSLRYTLPSCIDNLTQLLGKPGIRRCCAVQ